MMNYDHARLNMVESQIRPNKVTDPTLIDVMGSLPRERFVPETLRSIAYLDEDLEVAPNRHLMEPMVLARLVQAAAPQASDIVLDIACASGYSTALLAALSATVVALESDPELVQMANGELNELGVDNAVVVEGALEQGYAKQGPYNVILIGGALDEIPAAISDQLAEGGRLVTVLHDDSGLGRAVLVTKTSGQLSQRVLFDANVRPLAAFRREKGFVF